MPREEAEEALETVEARQGELNTMLDCLLTVQRILTRDKDAKRLDQLRPLTDAIQGDYLSFLKSTLEQWKKGVKHD